MKKILASTILAAGVLTTAAQAEVKVGLGVDVFNTYSNPAATSGPGLGDTLGSTPVVRVPVTFGAWRVEPRIAYISGSTNNDNIKTTDTASFLALGIGGYYKLANEKNYNMFVGGHIDSYGLTLNSGVSGAKDTEVSGLQVGAVVGVEYFMVENVFSLSSELGYAYTSTSVDPGSPAKTIDSTQIHPITSVTFRYYF